MENIYDLRRADALVVFNGQSTTGGLFFEVGMAYALQKRLALIGDPEGNVFFELLDRYPDIQAVLGQLQMEVNLIGILGAI
jgi:hypothetical protein